MVRGIRKLSKELNKTLELNDIPAVQPKAILSELSRRNELLAARYYYYKTFYNGAYPPPYEYILKQLATEFYMKPATIPRIINNYLPKLKEIAIKNPSKQYFRTKEGWGHLVWP